MNKPIVVARKKDQFLAQLAAFKPEESMRFNTIKITRTIDRRLGAIKRMVTPEGILRSTRARVDPQELLEERKTLEAEKSRLQAFLAQPSPEAEKPGMPLVEAIQKLKKAKPCLFALPKRPVEELELERLRANLERVEREIAALPGRENGNGKKFFDLLEEKRSFVRLIENAQYNKRLWGGSVQGTLTHDEKRALVEKLEGDIEILTLKICDLLEEKEAKNGSLTSSDEQMLQKLRTMRAGLARRLKETWDTKPKKLVCSFVDDGLTMDYTHGSMPVGSDDAGSFITLFG